MIKVPEGCLTLALIILTSACAIVITLAPVSVKAQELLTGKIVFGSDRDGNQEIYIMDTDGSNQINLTNDPTPDNNPAWSPDGSRIAFISKRESPTFSLFFSINIMNVDGSKVTSPGDILMLCSNGLTDSLKDEEIGGIINTCSKLDEACANLIN